jgi:hypothetical protein
MRQRIPQEPLPAHGLPKQALAIAYKLRAWGRALFIRKSFAYYPFLPIARRKQAAGTPNPELDRELVRRQRALNETTNPQNFNVGSEFHRNDCR